MIVELVPTRRSVTYAAKCEWSEEGGDKIRRYERGIPYTVSEELGYELLATKRFQLHTAKVKDAKKEQAKAHAAQLVDKLASMGPDFLAKLDAFMGAQMAASKSDVITKADTAPAIAQPVAHSDDEVASAEITDEELAAIAKEEEAMMADPLPVATTPSKKKAKSKKAPAKKTTKK